MRLNLDPWQKEFLATKGDKILCTGRQVGKSEVCGMDAGEYAVKNPKTQPIVMIAPTERQAYALFEKTLAYLAEYHLGAIQMGRDRPTKTLIKLKTGVKIYCLPVGVSGLGIRFLTVGRLYADEAARIPSEVWSAITPALLTTGGDTILLSTPAGAVGEFYETWINKDGAYESFVRFSTNSETVVAEREICDTWTKVQREKALVKLEQAKSRMSNKQYAQEYLGEFIADLIRFFPDELIMECCILKEPKRYVEGNTYFGGGDIARLGEDESSFEIFDRTDRERLIHVYHEVTRKTLLTDTAKMWIYLNSIYKFKRFYIDDGGMGVGVLDILLDCPSTRRKVVAINNRSRPIDHDDKKKKIMKEDLYNNLKALMEQGRIKMLNSEDIIESFRSIQYEYTKKANQLTTLRIFGNYAHIVEGIIRAVYCTRDKSLNIWCG